MEKQQLIDNTQAFLFDLDGTLYIDGAPVSGAIQTLNALRAKNKRIVFLTNNSSKTQEEYRLKLMDMGLFAPQDAVYTSAMATVPYLKEKYPNKKVYLLGTNALKKEFGQGGITLSETEPEVLVLAYDVTLSFEKLKAFDGWLRKGLPYVATHPDDVCPTKEGSMPDVGSFIALFEKSAGRTPDVIIGKPTENLGGMLEKFLRVSKAHMCMVGDRMYTDIRFANNNGMHSILVLSGETTRESMKNFPDVPDLVLDSVRDLL